MNRHAAALALVAFPLPAYAQVDRRPFDETCAAVRERFHDRDVRARVGAALCDEFGPRAAACGTVDDLHALINEMLGRLQASHTVLIAGDVWRDHFEAEFQGKASVRAGLELGRFPEGLFITAVHEGGPAARAGLRLGERVVEVNGLPAEGSRRIADAGSDPGRPGVSAAVLRVEAEETVELVVQAGPARVTRRRVRLRPGPVSLLEATRAGARVVERDGRRIAILHPWHFMHWGMVRAMREALDGPLAGADALVLDLRGRGGRTPVMWGALALFTARRDGTSDWDRPAVALIDGSTRSAKEIFAWHWRRMGLGRLVGRRTAGAVLGSDVLPLSDGSRLLLAVADVRRLTGGESLEGAGLEPDVPVDAEIPYCDGRDEILERGIAAALDEVRRTAGGVRFYGVR